MHTSSHIHHADASNFTPIQHQQALHRAVTLWLESRRQRGRYRQSSLCVSSPSQCLVPMRQLVMEAACAAAVPGEHQPQWCSSPRPARPCGPCAHKHAHRHGRHGAVVLCGSRTDAGGWTDTLGGGTQRSSSQACAWDVARGAWTQPAPGPRPCAHQYTLCQSGAVRQVALGVAASSCALALFLAAPTPGTAAALVSPPEAPAASVSTSISDKEVRPDARVLLSLSAAYSLPVAYAAVPGGVATGG